VETGTEEPGAEADDAAEGESEELPLKTIASPSLALKMFLEVIRSVSGKTGFFTFCFDAEPVWILSSPKVDIPNHPLTAHARQNAAAEQ
jgi:hypothetical protein